MNESEWLACEDPGPMLKHWEAKASSRKSRLLACAFCRQRWDFLRDDASRSAVEIAERYADKLATKRALIAARKAARAVVMAIDEPYWELRAAHAALNAVEEREGFVFGAAVNISGAVVCNNTTQDKYEVTKATQSALLRDVMGNPFCPVRLDSSLVTPGALSLAQAAYAERALPSGHLDLSRLAVLSDALEEAGCTDAAILSHLRSAGPHVRGCWALDLILGRN
jgi:hypothetical protein